MGAAIRGRKHPQVMKAAAHDRTNGQPVRADLDAALYVNVILAVLLKHVLHLAHAHAVLAADGATHGNGAADEAPLQLYNRGLLLRLVPEVVRVERGVSVW